MFVTCLEAVIYLLFLSAHIICVTVPLKTEDFLTKTLRFDWIEYTEIVKSKHKIHLTFSLVSKKFDDIYLKLIR